MPPVSPKIFLAPMEGVIDAPFRHLITQLGGVDYCVTEFLRVTDRELPGKSFTKICPELRNEGDLCGKTASGTPVLLQLLGGHPQPLAENAAKGLSLGAPGIDLNFGCPAKTVNRHDGGASLLQYPDRIYKICQAIKSVTPNNKTFSVKIRLGFNDKTLAIENSLAAQEAGADWLTVHARTKKEGYKPPAHWDWIAKIKEQLQIPVVANGDIWSPNDFSKCQAMTGCSQFMIGRGAVAQPNLAAMIKDNQDALAWLDIKDKVKKLFTICLLSEDGNFNEKYAIARTKQWLKLLGRGYPEAEKEFEEIKRETSLSVFKERFFRVSHTDNNI